LSKLGNRTFRHTYHKYSVSVWESINNYGFAYLLVIYMISVLCYVVEPTILSKIEKTLTNDSLADVVLEQSLICLKEDWMK